MSRCPKLEYESNSYWGNFDVNKTSKSLLEILQVPLFLDAFVKTYEDSSALLEIYEGKIVRKANILNSYVNKILSDIKSKSEIRKNVLEFTLNYWLPAIAFEMAKGKNFRVSANTPAKILNSDYFINNLDYDDEKIRVIMNSENFLPKTICEKDFSLISTSNGNLQFNNHIWRDFFAAKHITNILKLNPEYITEEALKNLESTLDETIYRFVGELITDENGKCECDFEKKYDLEIPSPIESFMQNIQKKLSATATKNLIEIMKISRNNYITAKYDNLDLSETSFLNCDLPCSSFKNAVIKEASFVPKGHNTLFNIKAAFSTNGKFLCSLSDHGLMILHDIQNDNFERFSLESLINKKFAKLENFDIDKFIEKNLSESEKVNDYASVEKEICNLFEDASYELGKTITDSAIFPVNENDFVIKFDSDVMGTKHLIVRVNVNELSYSEVDILVDDSIINSIDTFQNSYDYNREIFEFGEYSIICPIQRNEKVKFLKNGKLFKEYPRYILGDSAFGNSVLCFDGKKQVAIRNYSDITIWDLEQARKTTTLFGKCSEKQLKSLPDDSCVVSSTDNRIRCYSQSNTLEKVFYVDNEIAGIETFANGKCLLVRCLTDFYTVNLETEKILKIDSFEDDLFRFKIYEEGVIIAFAGCDDPNAIRVYTYENDSPEKLIFQSSRHSLCFLDEDALIINSEKSEVISKQGSNYYEVWNYKTGEIRTVVSEKIRTEFPGIDFSDDLDQNVDPLDYDFNNYYNEFMQNQERNRLIGAMLPLNVMNADFSESILKEPYTEDWLKKAFYEQLQDNGAKVSEKYVVLSGYYIYD